MDKDSTPVEGDISASDEDSQSDWARTGFVIVAVLLLGVWLLSSQYHHSIDKHQNWITQIIDTSFLIAALRLLLTAIIALVFTTIAIAVTQGRILESIGGTKLARRTETTKHAVARLSSLTEEHARVLVEWDVTKKHAEILEKELQISDANLQAESQRFSQLSLKADGLLSENKTLKAYIENNISQAGSPSSS